MALYSGKRLYCCSTAAGPAFEGNRTVDGHGGKRRGDRPRCGSGGALCSHVIGGGKAAGVCGSGVVDAMSAFLELGLMDETGCLTKDPVFISERVSISQRDVRMVQLAKSAVCAGVQTLIEKRRNFDGGGRPAGDRRRLWELFES